MRRFFWRVAALKVPPLGPLRAVLLTAAAFFVLYLALGFAGARGAFLPASWAFAALFKLFGEVAAVALICLFGGLFGAICGAAARKCALNAALAFGVLAAATAPFASDGWIKFISGFEWIFGLLFTLCLVYVNFSFFSRVAEEFRAGVRNLPRDAAGAAASPDADGFAGRAEELASVANADGVANADSVAITPQNAPEIGSRPESLSAAAESARTEAADADSVAVTETTDSTDASAFISQADFAPQIAQPAAEAPKIRLTDAAPTITELPPLPPLCAQTPTLGDKIDLSKKSPNLPTPPSFAVLPAAANDSAATPPDAPEICSRPEDLAAAPETAANIDSVAVTDAFATPPDAPEICSRPEDLAAAPETAANIDSVAAPAPTAPAAHTAAFIPPARKKVALATELAENAALLADLELADGAVKPKDFALPPTDLLTPPPPGERAIDERAIDEKISRLLAKLAQFKIDGDVVRTYTGPVVTTFEFKPAANVKLSKIAGLADDLAMELRALSIRIQAPIPGKDVVGIEIPNDESETIYIRELFENELFAKSKSPLTLALGKDIVGNSFITDLKKLPHLLIAGTTGSGKSVGINAMVLSLLYRNSPRQLRLLMIDPKMLEFSMYNDIPHLLVPVITRPDKATIALKNMVAEMERRYTLMSQIRVKNIESFNEHCAAHGLDEFAYVVIIIDELADLMMTAGKEVEVYIARLAQMARACGMHLIVATQRPSVDVITGLIKANLPSRLSYKVSTQMDSKVILDTRGAESLLGRGDSLFTPPGTSQIVRLHAPFSSEEEIIRVVEFLKRQEPPCYDEAILADASAARELTPEGPRDELFDEALRVMREDGKTSISYLQRRLQIGYNRAANIIEQLEAEGHLSAPNAKGVREILD